MRTNLITRLKEEWNNLDPVDPLRGLIADVIDALAKAQQEPVAYMDVCEKGQMSDLRFWSEPDNRHQVSLYTSPTASPSQSDIKPWVSLTDEEIAQALKHCSDDIDPSHEFWRGIAKAIEAKLREKNA